MVVRDAAETDRLAEAIAEILPALEALNTFDHTTDAGCDRAVWETGLGGALPEAGAGLETVLRQLREVVIPNGLQNGAPGFSGWITTAPTTSGTVAALASTVAGSQRWWVQPFNYLEGLALDWLAQLLGLPADWQGTFTSGGSVANLIALGAARQAAFERVGDHPSRDGLPADRRWRLYASSEVHHVVTRAAGVLGLGRRSVADIPCDDRQRIDLDRLQEALEADRREGVLAVAVVATAGTVNSGAVDPIAEMVEIAARYETWLHVDGAYGLFGRLDPRVESLYEGLDRADSVAVDPHKWLAAPVGCGATFVRDRGLLGRAFTTEPAEYLEGAAGTAEVRSMFDDFGEIFHEFNVEHSSPSRGVLVWAILREIGARGMRERVIRHNDFARDLAGRVRDDERLELLAEPVLSICCFRYRAAGQEEEALDDLNRQIAARLRAEGDLVPSTTRVDGRFAIRPCYINPRTTIAEVDALARRVREIGDSIVDAMSGS
jgi:aromatic-L-amino-acid decarboxylase